MRPFGIMTVEEWVSNFLSESACSRAREKRDRRHEERQVLPDPLPVLLTLETNPFDQHRGYILNISTSGLGLRVERWFFTGANVRVQMDTVAIRGVVRYCVATPNQGCFSVGMSIDGFERLSGEQVQPDWRG